MNFINTILLISLIALSCSKNAGESPKKNNDSTLIAPMSVGTTQFNTGVLKIENVLDTLRHSSANESLGKFTSAIDSVYLPIMNTEGIADSLPAVIFLNQDLLPLSDSTGSNLIIRKLFVELINQEAEWKRIPIFSDIFFEGKVVYSKQFTFRNPSSRFGFGGEETYYFSILLFQGIPIIERASLDAPSLASDASSEYFVFGSTGLLEPLSQPEEVIFRGIHIEKDSAFSYFSSGCMTCRIPLNIDLTSRSIVIVSKDSTIFSMKSADLELVPEYFDSKEPLTLFNQPLHGSKGKKVQAMPNQSFRVIKLSVPRGNSMSMNDVWAYIELNGKSGWIHTNDQNRLNLNGCD